MKIWQISDLHLSDEEIRNLEKIGDVPDADIAVILGDLSDFGSLNIEWCAKHIRPYMPVIYVPGNHDYYYKGIYRQDSDARELAQRNDIIYLNNDTVIVDNVRFIGGTLWSDFSINVFDDDVPEHENVWRNMQAVLDRSDFKKIFLCEEYSIRLRPWNTAAIHKKTINYFSKTLSQDHDGETIILSHYSPLKDWYMPGFEFAPSHPAYASDQSGIIEKYKPDMWLFGHLHDFVETTIGETKVSCNPKGYSDENTGFRWDYIHDI